MKKLIAWLSKGSKITQVLKHIYQALVIAKNLISGSESGIIEAGISSNKVTEKINFTQRYIELALKYLNIILGWLGISLEEREAIARSTNNEMELDRQLANLVIELKNDIKENN